MTKQTETVTLRRGIGYWDLTRYGIGGAFCRAAEPIQITIQERFARGSRGKGCDAIGLTLDGVKIAFDTHHAEAQA